MKSYLDLVALSARARRRQSRMIVATIALSVLLATGIFGMADMFVRSQILLSQKDYGHYHINIRNLTDEQARMIGARPDVKAAARYDTLNFSGSADYTVFGKPLIICGADEAYLTQMEPGTITEGRFPETDGEALIEESARRRYGLSVGDEISVLCPDGTSASFTLTGFITDVAKTTKDDVHAIFVTMERFYAFAGQEVSERGEPLNPIFLVEFRNTGRIRRSIEEIEEQYDLGEYQIAENVMLLGLLGQSGESFMGRVYQVAAALCVLVAAASILMIAGSMSSSVAQHTSFYGMLACLGATRKQIMRLVRREALYWCRVGIPLGVGVGIAGVWGLSAALRALAPMYLGEMPVWAVSLPGVCAGVGLGLATVLVAAHEPAVRASRVSPLCALNGQAGGERPAGRAANTGVLRVETALGVSHATGSVKGFLLMTGSFALSIVLFLAFSVVGDFAGYAVKPLRPWTADISVYGANNAPAITREQMEAAAQNPAVKRVYGRMFAYDVAVTLPEGERGAADILSYEENQFGWAKRYTAQGGVAEVMEQPFAALAVYDGESALRVGDVVACELDGKAQELRIAGVLSQSPFDSAPGTKTLIVSEETFRLLTGETRYTIADMQLRAGATQAQVDELRALFDPSLKFEDKRLSNASTRGAMAAFGIMVYGFLTLIALITVCNIVSSMALSVNARLREYGAMRAVGMSLRQLRRMVAAEAMTYGLCGSVLGGAAGLLINRLMFEQLVAKRWGAAWTVPGLELGVILAVVALSLALALRAPFRRIREMSIVETIGAL
ncbi:MAG: FtsX-like permease family protein [Clostridia bacterium]|nr:FtsX-like permease family protein [Clostridia bacterium]